MADGDRLRGLPRRGPEYADRRNRVNLARQRSTAGGLTLGWPRGRWQAKRRTRRYSAAMLRYFPFRQDLLAPVPAKEIYIKRGPGRGWPEECPPIRSANAFGFDLLANFDLTFTRSRNGWRVQGDRLIDSDFDYAAAPDSPGMPLSQRYAWFWEKGQALPHAISDNVYRAIANQVKVSSFLFLKTDPNELLLMTDVPNVQRPWRPITALVETDWYPASYPWHCVIELDRSARRIRIHKGEPLCRVVPVRRDTYFAQQMGTAEFDDFFARGQQWLAAHGSFEHQDRPAQTAASPPPPGIANITRTYGRQQAKSKFLVIT